MHAHGKGAKGIVAGMGQGFLEVYPAVHRPVAFPDVGIPDLQPAATFKVFIEVRHLFIQGGIRNQHLDGGARRIKAIGSPVQERAVLPLGQLSPPFLHAGRVYRGSAHHGDDAPGGRIQHYRGTTAALQGIISRLLHPGIHRQPDIVAPVRLKELTGRAQVSQLPGLAGQLISQKVLKA